MIKNEFIELTKAEKVVLLLKSGEKLSQRNSTGFDIVLFLLDELFAELWYYENTNRIVKANFIESDSILVNYPNLINMPQVAEILIESKL